LGLRFRAHHLVACTFPIPPKNFPRISIDAPPLSKNPQIFTQSNHIFLARVALIDRSQKPGSLPEGARPPHATARHASVVQECGSGLQLPAAPAWPPVFKRRGRRHRTSTSTSCAAKAERNKLPKGKANGRAVTARGGQRREGIAGDGRRSATTGGDGVRAFRAAPARRALW